MGRNPILREVKREKKAAETRPVSVKSQMPLVQQAKNCYT